METVKAFVLGATVALGPGATVAAEPGPPVPTSTLSPALLDLFRAEMRELLGATQAIAAALPLGEWERIAAVSRQMKASYILEKKLTPAQRKELGAVPEHFVQLDAAFHARTDKLAEAAELRDPEAVTFHFGRMLEACVGCHAAYATTRFPHLGATVPEPHHH